VQLFYWSAENSCGGIDFLVQNERYIHAIEVKAEENLCSKSLRAFNEEFEDMNLRRFSLSRYREEVWTHNLPFLAIGNINNWKRSTNDNKTDVTIHQGSSLSSI
jgi:predicted AAA+ superfamily ATPase